MSAPEKPKRRYNPARGLPPSVENRFVDELKIDPGYQRRVENPSSQALIRRIAMDWDWRLCMPLVVSRRADGLYVIDGQHRLAGARERGDIPWLPCLISTYESPADEARMFVMANRARKPITRLEDFHAAIEAGDPAELRIKEVVDAAGLTIAGSAAISALQPGEVAFPVVIGRALRKHPDDGIVPQALGLLADAFRGQVLVHGSAMFSALVLVLAHPPKGFALATLRDALRMFDAISWNGLIGPNTGGDKRVTAMRRAVLEAYDEKQAAAAAARSRPLINLATVPSSLEARFGAGAGA